MILRSLLLVTVLAGLAAPSLAAPVTYIVSIDTSSITGTAGALDFNFNPGPLVSQSATVQIFDFLTDGTLAVNCPCGTGDATGVLPATVTLTNGTGFNDYFEGFTFGTTISFDVSLGGPALAAPDGTSTSGSAFAFSMFSDSQGTVPALTSDTTNGYALRLDVNLDGSTTLDNFSSQTGVTLQPVPEPSSLMLSGAALLLGVLQLRSRGRVVTPPTTFPQSLMPKS